MSHFAYDRFVGAQFDHLPFVSGTGAFVRVSRLNRYQAKDYRFAFGMSVRRHDDLNYVMTFSALRKEQLANALRIPEHVVQQWDLGRWMPFQCDAGVLAAQHHFRFCPECLRFGYHTLLHQLPWISRCPWHGAQLRTECLRCGHLLRLDGLHGSWLGTCHCGYDHVHEPSAVRGFPSTTQMEQVCISYLAWALQSREHTQLFAPSPKVHSIAVLKDAFDLPIALRHRADAQAGQPKLHRVSARPEPAPRSGTEDAHSVLAKLEGLGDSRAAMIEAPGRLAVRISTAAVQLARKLPPASLSDAEMTLFLEPTGAAADPDFVPASRKSILEIRSLPLAMVGHRAYLDLHCISPVARHMAYAVWRAVGGERILDVGQPALPDGLLDLQTGLSAVNELVARGYAEGIRIAIGHHLPDLYRTGRNRPHLSEPWVLIRRAPGQPLRIEIVWARLPYSPD